ncbi:hypothetical protein SBA4_4910001 [Candidatus Sulfopaludibacter sp. SbA4]|nr:hypothetical protein SBA4_4910001 [Candidatus Sulfopaludibacter sp. SbA4]
MSEWLPGDRVEMERVAAPAVNVCGLPRVVEPSLNVTVPVAVGGETAAVSVTFWPGVDEVGAAFKDVVVAVWPTDSVTAGETLGASLASPP